MNAPRRRFLRTLSLCAGSVGVAFVGGGSLLGRALVARWRAPRRRRPDDLAPIPWIGHC